MAEQVAQQMARLKLEVQSLQAQLQARPTVTKDLSLVSLIPKWAGNDKAVPPPPLHEFFEAIEGSALVGNWSEQDMIQVATLKLATSARAFYNGNLDLHEPNVTWANFKATFKRRFRDVRTSISLHSTSDGKTENRRDSSGVC
jgi:hypothetical protein